VALFIGLGNPGTKYENTRHNIGFKIIDQLVSELGARDVSKASFEGILFKYSNHYFLKPTTYMNLSGKSVLAVKQFYKIDLEDIIVIHDDIDLPFGALRFKKGGGHGGHNGLKSIDTMIGQEYLRVRVGVGKPEHKSQVADYVLHDFSKEEEQHLPLLIAHTTKSCIELAKGDLTDVKGKYSLKSIEGLL